MSDNLGFLDLLFDIDGDGKVTDMDFIDDMAIFHMIRQHGRKLTANSRRCRGDR